MLKIAINGFGRIGRTAARILLTHHAEQAELVAVNDLTDPKTLAHLFTYDSNYRTFSPAAKSDSDLIIVGEKQIKVFAEQDPAKLPWDELNVDVVLECTGHFTDGKTAAAHLKAGARRVVISAPADNAPTHVLGVNDETAHESEVINNASCTTNCISPVAAVMHAKFGVAKAMMTTIHSYTQDQNLQDGPHKDLRRARAAAQNIVPTTTGAAKATTEVIPELKGLFDGLAIRVPTPVGSLADFTFLLKSKTTVDEIKQVLIDAAKSPRYRGILEVTDEPLVSSDVIGNPASAIVDLSLTQVIDGDMAKVIAWYDNEYGYSCRLVEMALKVGAK
ncbi:MAG: type I glyceraldehyde-3-phosphate dehydrogenase [Candidatus Berkelbacteria bacterium]|nr:MAG: type I glyceraldehyde-3-phosphate dehydrogenase [Candidatus Berkelbacteria bacterium]QQG52021.1 MAG: type I glyceraldehyde-3-phosphate dehydrogenase [Candidatus Berkelbacteria bacterium]